MLVAVFSGIVACDEEVSHGVRLTFGHSEEKSSFQAK